MYVQENKTQEKKKSEIPAQRNLAGKQYRKLNYIIITLRKIDQTS